ncbi:MAG: GNAT family N-acetyltransferase [Erysipelotrichales bacterium]|nr:GNAT family N-acetyltransferase [Erysipelotrichales bacterium]
MIIFETPRLIFRCFKDSDLADFNEYAKVEGVGEAAGWPHHKSLEDSKKILDKFISDDEVFAIVYRENNKVIGSLGLHRRAEIAELKDKKQRELGYVLSKDYWGNGLMTEAASAAITYAFNNFDLEFIMCAHFDINERSKRVIEKTGFKFYNQSIYKTVIGEFNSLRYILSREDYLENVA